MNEKMIQLSDFIKAYEAADPGLREHLGYFMRHQSVVSENVLRGHQAKPEFEVLMRTVKRLTD